MRYSLSKQLSCLSVCSVLALSACGSEDSTKRRTGTGGVGGSAGTGGDSGSSGVAGAGALGGTSGSAGTGGSTAGAGGSTAGAGGSTAGAGGSTAGAGGSTAGAAGTAGNSGNPTCATTVCDTNATCDDTSGTAICTCNSGFSGTGMACADIDECATVGTCTSAFCANSAGSFSCTHPQSCAEVLAADPLATDGTFTLYMNGDPALPWLVYCAEMATTPAEYITLPSTANSNFSTYHAGGNSPGTDVTTTYTRVRFDPSTMLVDISDQTFSTSSGSLNHGTTVSSMPYGVAMSCDSTASGTANIDLTTTAFKVVDPFCAAGAASSGGPTFSSNDQIVNITGGGFCGWTSSAPCLFNPFNAAGGPSLDLAYLAPATCADLASRDPSALDGDQTLYIGGDPTKPWLAYCHDMAGTPIDYITLDPGSAAAPLNFSQYTAGGASPGSNVLTAYSRVRFNPMSMQVDIGDQRFATSSGALTHSGTDAVSSMPFGVAMSCDTNPSGVGNINFAGTAFILADTFCVSTGGSATISADSKNVDLTGGGFCGWTAPNPCPFNPFNGAGGFALELAYQ